MTDFATRRRTIFFTGVFITSIIIITVTFAIVSLMQNAQEDYDQKIRDLHQIENLALDVQYTFKLQVQEWKNILLRGDDQSLLEKYYLSFSFHHDLTQQKTNELIASLNAGSSILNYATDFKQQHKDLLIQYQNALDVFVSNQFDAKLADKTVRGIDRKPDQLLIELSKQLEFELEHLQITFNTELYDTKVKLGIAFFAIQGLLCLILGRLTARLLNLSLTHKVTGLSNRNYFIESVNDCLKVKRDATIAIIDIDEFKIINETCGNLGGDEYLKKIGILINDLIKQNGKVFSIGADLTAVIIFLPHSEAIDKLNQIAKQIENFKFQWSDISVSLKCSVISYRVNSKPKESVESVLNDLYVGLQVAKQDSNSTLVDFNKKDGGIAWLQKQLRMVHQITNILENKDAVLFFQGIYPIQKKSSDVYYEVLLRLKNKKGEYESPGLFLKTAERFKLIKNVDKYVITELLVYLTEHPDDHFSYSINLSGQTLSDSSFVKFFKSTFQNVDIDLSRLSFEITESDAISNIDSAKLVIQCLQQFGCKVVLDDFGTGMSSYAYIADMKVSTIKIDGTFVQDLPNKASNLAIIKSIVALAREMSIETVAEFVETQAELDLLEQAGVDYAQGFYLNRPELLVAPSKH
ncbi:EAL domain-containing protein [Glaciecola petra]|uniref:GGDEF domain-containing protein n=1 Tax=Glaciecola petra TaxID=3075602 RepID=A0ABU2ZS60_9ALTE|nr:GGDEF domain-containing protein [Aestuariibacter sp. P117]MDT0595468.1 GGDEF domain-containing protein [Aestuariibacter sp. P117]